jgi:hypothetical protein
MRAICCEAECGCARVPHCTPEGQVGRSASVVAIQRKPTTLLAIEQPLTTITVAHLSKEPTLSKHPQGRLRRRSVSSTRLSLGRPRLRPSLTAPLGCPCALWFYSRGARRLRCYGTAGSRSRDGPRIFSADFWVGCICVLAAGGETVQGFSNSSQKRHVLTEVTSMIALCNGSRRENINIIVHSYRA